MTNTTFISNTMISGVFNLTAVVAIIVGVVLTEKFAEGQLWMLLIARNEFVEMLADNPIVLP